MLVYVEGPELFGPPKILGHLLTYDSKVRNTGNPIVLISKLLLFTLYDILLCINAPCVFCDETNERV